MLDGISFAYPWLFLCLPLLFFLAHLRKKPKFSAVPSPAACLPSAGRGVRELLQKVIQPLLHLGFIVLLVLAAARPQIVTSRTIGEENRRNIVLSLDTSRSMEAKDFISSQGIVRRIDGVKAVTKRFIEERSGDRIGLVLFGSRAFLQAPLTVDHALLASLVGALRVGVAGDGTAIGDGLGVALKRIEELPARTRAVILLTDGVSNSGRVEPIKAARIAKELGVKVYTIGIGSHRGGFVELQRGLYGRQRIQAGFDEESLREIAEITGGKYYFASNANELDQVYRQIDELEQTEQKEFRFLETEELGAPCVAIALLLFLFHFLFSQTLFRVVP